MSGVDQLIGLGVIIGFTVVAVVAWLEGSMIVENWIFDRQYRNAKRNVRRSKEK